MKAYKLFFLIISILLISCKEPHNADLIIKSKSIIDVTKYTGNAMVFFNEEICGDRLYVIPVIGVDNNIFKKIDVLKAIEKSLCIQMHLDRKRFLSILNDKSKSLLMHKVCNLPCDSMYYSRVFISYKNYESMVLWHYDKNHNIVKVNNYADSCSTKVIMETDSSEIRSFRIYK
jgi:hypothetical protein